MTPEQQAAVERLRKAAEAVVQDCRRFGNHRGCDHRVAILQLESALAEHHPGVPAADTAKDAHQAAERVVAALNRWWNFTPPDDDIATEVGIVKFAIAPMLAAKDAEYNAVELQATQFAMRIHTLTAERDKQAAELRELRGLLRSYQEQRDFGFIELLSGSAEDLDRLVDSTLDRTPYLEPTPTTENTNER